MSHPSPQRAPRAFTILALLTTLSGVAAGPAPTSAPVRAVAGPVPQATLQDHCDIAGAGVAQKTADAAACRDLCTATKTCGAFVFVSGWNTCFLKDKKARIAPLRFYAGRIDGDAAARQVADAGYDRDDSGKDLRKLPHTKNAAACATACVEEPQCRAFAYLEGYSDCYLKAAHGTLRAKIFSCGLVEGR